LKELFCSGGGAEFSLANLRDLHGYTSEGDGDLNPRTSLASYAPGDVLFYRSIAMPVSVAWPKLRYCNIDIDCFILLRCYLNTMIVGGAHTLLDSMISL